MVFQGGKRTNTAKWQKGFWSVSVGFLASIWLKVPLGLPIPKLNFREHFIYRVFLDVLASLGFKLSLAQGVQGLGKFPKKRVFGCFPKNQVMQVSLAHL